MPARETRVLVVDDQVSVRQLVAETVLKNGHGSCRIIGETGSGMDGLRLFRQHLPDMVIAALALPEMNGAEMVRAIRAERSNVRILVYTGTRNRELILAGLEARPHGFVHKTDALSVLYEALGAVARGACFFSPFATRFFDEMGRPGTTSVCALSAKERQVLQLVAEGQSTKEAACRLCMSPKTVEHYRAVIMRKLGLHDVASLTRYAVRCGLVSAE